MRYVPLSCIAVCLVALWAGACGPTGAAPGAGGASDAGPSTPRRGLTHNECPHNSLDPAALRFNAGLRHALTTIPLTTDDLRGAVERDASLGNQLADPLTQDLMQYLVSCALGPDRAVMLPPGTSSTMQVPGEFHDLPGVDGGDGWKSPGPWHGELGLCDEWATGAPSAACQERVSSCVLARVNALNKKVIISVRGPSTELFPLQPQVAVEREYRERSSDPSMPPSPLVPILSFGPPCDAGDAGDAGAANCGWTPLYVGRCTANANVTLAPRACSDPQHQPMLRVCKGLYGCDNPLGMPPPAGAAPPYAHFLQEGEACASWSFTCPDDGPLVDGSPGADQNGPGYGYFSVMAASSYPLSEDAGTDGGVDLVAASSAPVEYPAPEADVFTYREGAFYGNIFSTTGTGKLLLPDDLFACYSDTFSCGLAHLTDRFCAGAGAFQCPATENPPTQVMQCFGQNVPSPCFGETGAVCHGSDGSPGGYYDDCAGSDAGSIMDWSWPITVYLNHPCDLSPDGNCHGNPPLAANLTALLPNPTFGTDINCLPEPPLTITGNATGGFPPYAYAWMVTILNADSSTRAGPMTIGNQATTSTGSITASWWFSNLDMAVVQGAPGEPIRFTLTVTDSSGAQATVAETVDWQCVPP